MSIFTGTDYRISFLTPRLIRLEYQEEGLFEDRPTTFARNRSFPEVPVTVRRSASGPVLETEYLRVSYDEKPFSKEGLAISVKGKNGKRFGRWHFLDPRLFDTT